MNNFPHKYRNNQTDIEVTGNGGETMEAVRVAVRHNSNHSLWGYETEAEARSVATTLVQNRDASLYSQYLGGVERQNSLWWVRVE